MVLFMCVNVYKPFLPFSSVFFSSSVRHHRVVRQGRQSSVLTYPISICLFFWHYCIVKRSSTISNISSSSDSLFFVALLFNCFIEPYRISFINLHVVFLIVWPKQERSIYYNADSLPLYFLFF